MLKPKQAAEHELLIGGVGGWGIVAMGDMLAKAALREYKQVTWFPCYATMMRGGESECCVIFSQERIPSPVIYKSGAVIVLGAWRIKDFVDRVRPGGIMLIDTTGVEEEHKVKRDDIRVNYLPAMETAIHLGNARNANLVMLGAYIEMTKTVSPQLLIAEVEKRFSGRGKEAVVLACKEAFTEGMKLVEKIGEGGQNL